MSRCHAIEAVQRASRHTAPSVQPSVKTGVGLLGDAVGRPLTDPELQTAELIVRLCGRLPLAIMAVGARLSATRGWTLHKLAQRLLRADRRLDELCFADLDVRARFDVTYQRLTDGERSVLRHDAEAAADLIV
jgi:hypothetical protein